ncbi:hypothetical protein [Azospirillum argentinense]|uniref:hypothetical protein n=1 Tax=Azospirillum argentinense TaxID=2970906 RepID=UPI0010C14229|nr:hypothetical protein [Azospirillum argentinense]
MPTGFFCIREGVATPVLRIPTDGENVRGQGAGFRRGKYCTASSAALKHATVGTVTVSGRVPLVAHSRNNAAPPSPGGDLGLGFFVNEIRILGNSTQWILARFFLMILHNFSFIKKKHVRKGINSVHSSILQTDYAPLHMTVTAGVTVA